MVLEIIAVVKLTPAPVQRVVRELSEQGNKWCLKEDLRRASKYVVHSVVTRPPSAEEYSQQLYEVLG